MDFREVNQNIVQKNYPIPKIMDIMKILQSFTYATTLDMNMGYYTINLSRKAQFICTIVILNLMMILPKPFGLVA